VGGFLCYILKKWGKMTPLPARTPMTAWAEENLFPEAIKKDRLDVEPVFGIEI
jgi:hypothetical protein